MTDYQSNSKKVLIIYSIIILIVGMVIGYFIGKHMSKKYVSNPAQSRTQISCKSCKEMRTCDEAKKYLASGCQSLDRDGDGIPCEDLCK